MKCLHGVAVGDLHLDRLQGHFPTDHIDLQLAELEKPFRYCYENGIKHLFLLGDIGEGRKDFTGKLVMSMEAQIKLLRFLRRHDGKINVHAYVGNHDFSQLDSNTLGMFLELTAQGMFKSVRFHEHPTELTIDGCRVNILPYPYVKPLSRKPALNFAHYEVSGAQQDNGRRFEGPKHHHGGQRFIQGHLHTPQVVRKQHHFAGTLYQLNFGESLPKGFAEFKYWQTTQQFRWRHVKTDPAFKMINLRVYKRADLKQLEANPLILYKLFVSDEVKLKASDLEPFPNVVNRLNFATEQEADELEQASFILESSALDLTYDDALVEHLRVKHKFDKAKLKRCKQIVEQFNVKTAK